MIEQSELMGKLEEIAAAAEPPVTAVNGKVAVESEDDLEIILPAGFAFRPLKQRHLEAFFDRYDTEEEHKSIHHLRGAVIRAAVEAEWFEKPLGLTVDTIGNMDNEDVKMLNAAINNYYVQSTRVKKS